jgi:uncharacterized protein (DUF2236 family)
MAAEPRTPTRSRDGRWAPLAELSAVMLGAPAGSDIAPLLADGADDPGLFGPDSVTWRLAREPLLLIGGGRALLMQVAHPLVAQGVVDHSDYERDPFGRLVRTVRWLVAVTFGTTAEAHAASREVRRVHASVRGELHAGNATAHVPQGTPYVASDPELSRWVLATIVQSMLVTYTATVGPLHRDDADRFVREWRAVAPLVHVRAEDTWQTAAALHADVATTTQTLHPVPASREAARVVLHPPLPSKALRPATGAAAFLTAGLLPPQLRRAYGLRWTPAHAAAHSAACIALRITHRVLPRRLRVSALHDAALQRSQGRGLGRIS